MSSEAAQKAYPARLPYNAAFERAMVQQEAFDAGAVEALRQAVARLAGDSMYESHYEGGGWATDVVERMADEWVVGQ